MLENTTQQPPAPVARPSPQSRLAPQVQDGETTARMTILAAQSMATSKPSNPNLEACIECRHPISRDANQCPVCHSKHPKGLHCRVCKTIMRVSQSPAAYDPSMKYLLDSQNPDALVYEPRRFLCRGCHHGRRSYPRQNRSSCAGYVATWLPINRAGDNTRVRRRPIDRDEAWRFDSSIHGCFRHVTR